MSEEVIEEPIPEPIEDSTTLLEADEALAFSVVKDSTPEVEPDDGDTDPGDPPGVTEVPTEWTPDEEEEEV